MKVCLNLPFLLPLVLLSLLTPVFAAAPTTFCKCTCFSNSTIIPLGDHPPDNAPPVLLHLLHLRDTSPNTPPPPASLQQQPPNPAPPPSSPKHTTGGSCTACNRQFCLSYNLPICKNAKEEDVFTTCFQRDSRKDEAVVWIFLLATGSLLGWAAVGRGWIAAMRERRRYLPVETQG